MTCITLETYDTEDRALVVAYNDSSAPHAIFIRQREIYITSVEFFSRVIDALRLQEIATFTVVSDTPERRVHTIKIPVTDGVKDFVSEVKKRK